MYPGLMTAEAVQVVYHQLSAPTFSPAPGNFASDQIVTISGPPRCNHLLHNRRF